MALNKTATTMAVEEEYFESETEINNENSVPEPARNLPQTYTQKATPTVVDASIAGVVLTEEEMDGLNLGFGAFPQIILDKGDFVCKSLDLPEIEEGFNFKIIKYRPQFLYKAKASEEEARALDPRIAYTYVKNAHLHDPDIMEAIGYWQEMGYKWEKSDYLEVLAELVLPGSEHDGEFVLLSLPPTSVPPFSGHVLKMKHKHGAQVSQVITRATAGKKLGEGQRTWKPWAFSFVSLVT